MKGLAVLVLRYKQPGNREFRVPLNIKLGSTEFPLGVALITLTLFMLCIINLFTKEIATVSGVAFTLIFFTVFEFSERVTRRQTKVHTELDQFNIAMQNDLTPQGLGVRPGNILVAVSTYYTLYHLEAALRRARTREAEIVVLHIRLLRRAASGEYELAPDQLFSTIEQLLFTKVLSIAEKEGKPVRLAVAASNDVWEGVLRATASLQSSALVVGSSSKSPITEQAREIGLAWERLPDPRPRLTLEIYTASGQEQVFYLGPHEPRLTPNEIDLLHKLWLQLSEKLPDQELHHHDIVHFALTELERQIASGEGDEIARRLRDHLLEIKDRRVRR